ncbi:Pol protein [Phytophthora palmivora]|uniref:Pol protein n=1 Tax=Phytophthora palmivora TaxID=4796 RepID=A0A2P4X389_9STRA|nr:Pol protein [Phytophthora palmivora]
MRVLAASLVGNPLPEHIKVAMFMDALKVGPSRTQLFRVHVNTMEEVIQIALQEEYSHRLVRTPTSAWQGHNASSGAVQGAPAAGASTEQVPMELAPESLGALETRKSSGGRLVVHASVRGYGDPFSVLIDAGASTNFARRQTVARNGDKYADALRESEGRGQVSVRLADGTVVNVPGVGMDLAVKLKDFDSTEPFLALDMDKYDLIPGMPWLEKHEPWVDEDVLERSTKQRATRLGSEFLENPEDPVYPLVKEYSDVVSKHPPSQLPLDRGMPPSRENAKSGMVRESKHSTPTFFVRKPNGKWRLVHAYNKLNNATVPAQTPIPRKDVLLNDMSGCTLYSALDLDQILMQESDIPLTAVSTKLNVLADALLRRPDYELAHVSRVTTDLYDRIRLAYQEDENYTPLVQFLSEGKDAKSRP